MRENLAKGDKIKLPGSVDKIKLPGSEAKGSGDNNTPYNGAQGIDDNDTSGNAAQGLGDINATGNAAQGFGDINATGNAAQGSGGGSNNKSRRYIQVMVSMIIAVLVLLMLFFPDNPAFSFLSGMMPGSHKSTDTAGYPLTRDLFLLDTFCELTIYEGGGEEAMSSAVTKLNYYDDIFNKSKEDSDISHINNRTSGTVEIEADTADMLAFAREFCEESGGILEPTIAPVSSLWDFKDEKKVPDSDKINEALTKVKSLKWNIEGNYFIAYDEDVRIDIGSFAKGYVADRIKEDMLLHGVTSAIINLGGNVLCIGKKPDGRPFEIAIMEPGKSAAHYSHIMDIDDDSIVTAGIYERSFEYEGVIYHHILDADTGYPVQNELESVTVIGDDSAVCDALCTTIFILGDDEGTEFINQYNDKHGTDYYAVFLYREGKWKETA